MSSTSSPGPTDTTTTRFSSPKRKREIKEEDDPTIPSSVRLRTDLPTRTLESTLEGSSSPRTKISKQLQFLNLHGTSDIPTRTLSEKMEFQKTVDSTLTTELGLGFRDIKNPKAKAVNSTAHSSSAKAPPAESSLEQPKTPASEKMAELPPLSTSDLEPPETPTLKPTTSPHPTLGPISPLSTTTMKAHFADQDSPSTIKTASRTSPQRMKSPPPASGSRILSDLVWDDSEITGHSPNDPTDDGYGINGIGFRPTAAMAYDRAQRRKRQVAEWKSREARDARMRRMERRRGMGAGLAQTEGGSRRVRFVEG